MCIFAPEEYIANERSGSCEPLFLLLQVVVDPVLQVFGNASICASARALFFLSGMAAVLA